MHNINWVSLILATLTPMVVGFIYYQKKLFGKVWAKTITMPKEHRINWNFFGVFCLSFLVCFLLSFYLLFDCKGPGQEGIYDTFLHGAFHGLGLAILVIIPVSSTGVLYNERSWKNMLVNAGYWFISLPIMGGILDMMNHL